jgi:hypothetical protein
VTVHHRHSADTDDLSIAHKCGVEVAGAWIIESRSPQNLLSISGPDTNGGRIVAGPSLSVNISCYSLNASS